MADYCFYLTRYGGTSIPIEEFPFFEARAAEHLAMLKRQYTVEAPDEDAESKAICAMADALAYFTAAQNGAGGSATSASIGSVSVSYGSQNAVDLSPKGQEKELYRCAQKHLEIYRGVC